MSASEPCAPLAQEARDRFWMEQALRQASQAAARGEVPVGAILVGEDQRLLGEAGNEVEQRQDALAHAEMLVLRAGQAVLKTWRLTGTTVYVTKEPCPMCAGALVHARVARIVFGVSDPKTGACGGAFNLFALPGLNHQCALSAGVQAAEALELLQRFFRARRGFTKAEQADDSCLS